MAPKITKATPKLDPELKPKTYGPANGFLNKVCINNPDIESPIPTKIAVIAFGNLKLIMMYCQVSLLAFPPNKLLKTSFIGIEIEPKLIFKINVNININDNIKINFMFREFLFFCI